MSDKILGLCLLQVRELATVRGCDSLAQFVPLFE
jgi:hypothetical protein